MKLNFRLIILTLATVFGLVFSAPSLLQLDSGKKVTLGLDLQGGLHMVLGVKSDEAIKSRIKSIASSIKNHSEKKEILIESFSFDDDSVEITLLDKDEVKNLKKFISEIQGSSTTVQENKISISLTKEEILRTKEQAISQSIETIRNRLDQFGLSEPTVTRQGADQILVEIAGIKTAQEEQRARELISRSAKLELMAVDEDKIGSVYNMTTEDAASYGDTILEDVSNKNEKYLVREVPILDGSMLTDAHVGFDQNNRPMINFKLNAEGAEIFGDFTGKNVKKRLAVVLDGKVYSAPVINERIGAGSGQISGNYTVVEAKDLAIALRSGSLLVPIYVMEKRSVGPSLGADSIRASLIALASGFTLVIIFMMFYYGLAGVIANIAVLVNLFIILGLISLLGATLTLPGMAGIVLHIGLAVDSNIIINERIREGLRSGLSASKAISEGYRKAMRAILDSNITQILACVILYANGTGAIKGFAVTLSLGLLASMVTAIIGTYGIYQLFMNRIEKNKNYTLWFGMSKRKGA